ncbi:MAG TPA: gephyrin-like molybdotransferase Glp [Bryobacteraceae bacterium]|jgi:molybdopterin molybdotransferase|nr:gephyrin-like molybdotransferase Glp [Bryobacteraceae bacterium]
MTFDEARACVLREVLPRRIEYEEIATLDASGRVLAEDIPADRDYPPFDRSARDGFAVRASETPGEFAIAGELRAGETWMYPENIAAGQAVGIMTGAALPPGTDSVVMIEHVERRMFPGPTGVGAAVAIAMIERLDRPRSNDVAVPKAMKPGENVTRKGTEAKNAEVVLKTGARIGYAETGLLAMVGRERVRVFRQPRVAILPTGDELVEPGVAPKPYQIRNSNAWSLAAQVRRAGGIPEILPIARDTPDPTPIERGLEADLLLLSGGVSAGRYDFVEQVLASLGAKFFFTRVLIQPGQPVVFGKAGEKFFFGLPGNPASTMVTFELFARAAIERLSGLEDAMLPLLRARLARDFQHKTGLTRFLPARLSEDGSTVEPLGWQGSGDIPAVARANAYLVAESDRESWKEGDDIRVLLK